MGRAPAFLLQLNEVSFDLVRRYTDAGELPTFSRILRAHGCARTSCPETGDHLEPWIQWVSAHTGMSYAEHGVFRLGDIVKHDLPQIWEQLEDAGLTVGAVCPMNAKNRLKHPAFFVPDPWTTTEVTGSLLLRKIHRAISQAVNDNAAERITFQSLFWLLVGLARFASPANYGAYVSLAVRSLKHSWLRAAFLDLFLADVFGALSKRSRVDFASLFLNAAAHVQHHYFKSSGVLGSTNENPAWYCPPGLDPILETYKVYDRILANLQRQFPAGRFIIATAITQVAHEQNTFYWRLRDHKSFFENIDVRPARVLARMSRDFVLEFETEAEAFAAASRLESIRDVDGEALFEVDNRGRDLFATLSYPHDIPDDFVYLVGNQTCRGLRELVVFVAIKNGEHEGSGYVIDTGLGAQSGDIELADLHRRILELGGGPTKAQTPMAACSAESRPGDRRILAAAT